MSRRVRIVVILASAAAVIIAGAGILAGTGFFAGTATPGQATGSGTPPATAITDSGQTAVTATDGNNGQTINLAVGDKLVVVLASVYWQFNALDKTGILVTQGPSVVVASAPGHGCVPGAGCGTVTTRYKAAAAGQVDVVAKRTVCGEAMMCTSTNGNYRMHVVVR